MQVPVLPVSNIDKDLLSIKEVTRVILPEFKNNAPAIDCHENFKDKEIKRIYSYNVLYTYEYSIFANFNYIVISHIP